jgi:hypothetical protein
MSCRRKLQRKGTKSAKRLLKKRSGHEANFARNTNHVISKSIVQAAKRTNRAIAIENLEGIRTRVRARRGFAQRKPFRPSCCADGPFVVQQGFMRRAATQPNPPAVVPKLEVFQQQSLTRALRSFAASGLRLGVLPQRYDPFLKSGPPPKVLLLGVLAIWRKLSSWFWPFCFMQADCFGEERMFSAIPRIVYPQILCGPPHRRRG